MPPPQHDPVLSPKWQGIVFTILLFSLVIYLFIESSLRGDLPPRVVSSIIVLILGCMSILSGRGIYTLVLHYIDRDKVE